MVEMDSLAEKSKRKGGFESLTDSGSTDCRGRCTNSSSDASSVETKNTKDCCSSPSALSWPIRNAQLSKCAKCDGSETQKNIHLKDVKADDDDAKCSKQGSKVSEMEMMKERFAKLLLGEDMSGNGKGVCTALAISNAITNLCATVFGQLWRLEPLLAEKKSMWQREMEWILSVSDHIVELTPIWQTFPDGSKLEVMTCRPRSDIFMNLPALRKLDNMLLEILDGFTNPEFWYVDQGVVAPDGDGSASFHKAIQRQEEKWWLPVPRVPPGGLLEAMRNRLIHKRECANQILKAAMAINSMSLAEMEVPESYLEALPKNGRACLGDFIYRYIISEQFSSECLLDCLDLSSEHVALEMANRVEASIYVWHRKLHPRPPAHPSRSTSKSSWGMVKDLMLDGDKRELFAERAENLLLCLKQRFPGLTQTTLDASKIQCNKDVGKSILEGYSRVLESLAFNIVARIDDLLYVDDLTRQSDKLSSAPKISVVAQRKLSIPCLVPVSGTPFKFKTASSTPSISPAPSLISPFKVDRTPLPGNNSNKPPRRGFGVKRALTNYLGGEAKAKNAGNLTGATSNESADFSTLRCMEGSERRQKESSSHQNGNCSRLIDR